METQTLQLQDIEEFLDKIKKLRQKQEEDDSPKIKATLTLSQVAFFYEKIRNSLDYKDEHLLIKNALERILKRKFLSYRPGDSLGKNIVFELISGGYISNESVSLKQVEQVSDILERYYYLFSASGKRFNRKTIFSLVACAIEEALRPEVKEKEELVNFTHKTIRKDLLLDSFLEDSVIDTQLYIAIHKTLLKSDYSTLKFRLFKRMIPQLEDSSIDVHQVVLKFEESEKTIDKILKNKLRFNFQKLCRKAVPPFSVLGKMIAKTPLEQIEASLKDENDFSRLVESSYSAWRDRAYDKIARSAVRSVIFIFFTKMVLAFILELPYDAFILKQINWFPLGLNLIFPPFYMFLSTYNITVPGKENLDAIKMALKKIVFKTSDFKYELRVNKRSSLKSFAFFVVYLLTFVVSFGAIIYALKWLKFNIVAGVLFFVFFSTVSFFAYRISRIANELSMVKTGSSAFEIITDFFSLPFIKLGQILSSNFQKINIFLFILDVIIEMPFKTIIEFLEEWSSYTKEKKENILNE